MLPKWADCEAACDNKTATPLQRFIYEYEPGDDAEIWRERLAAAIARADLPRATADDRDANARAVALIYEFTDNIAPLRPYAKEWLIKHVAEALATPRATGETVEADALRRLARKNVRAQIEGIFGDQAHVTQTVIQSVVAKFRERASEWGKLGLSNTWYGGKEEAANELIAELEKAATRTEGEGEKW